MYEIIIRYDDEPMQTEIREPEREINYGIHILDEPFVCSNCGNEIKGKASRCFFDSIDNELCKKCLTLQNRINKEKDKIRKIEMQLVDLEYEFFTRKFSK